MDETVGMFLSGAEMRWVADRSAQRLWVEVPTPIAEMVEDRRQQAEEDWERHVEAVAAEQDET